MKKLLVAILVVLMVLGTFTACSSGGNTTTSGDTSSAGGDTSASTTGETYDVGVILRLSDMYAAWMGDAFKAEAEKHGNLNVTVMDNQDDGARHIELVQNSIQQEFDFLIVQGRQGDLSDLYQQVIDAGIGLVQVNYVEDWSKEMYPSVTCDETALGRLIGELAAEQLPENAQVAILNGPAGLYLAEDRAEGMREGLETRDDIEIIDEQDAAFTKDVAMNKTSDWLQNYPDLVGVLAASDGMALGAVEAFRTTGNVSDFSDIFIYGIDGLTDACKGILDGDLKGSALQDATEFARVSIEMVLQDIAGEIDIVGGDFEPHTEFAPTLIDENNAQEQMDFYESLGMVQ